MTVQLLVDRGTDRLSVQYYDRPEAGDLLVIVPAMGVPARYYGRFAEALCDAGRAVAVADLRGTGASTPPAGRESGYGYADLADDLGAVLETVAEHRTGRRTFLLGHSLGGQICLMHLARSGRDDVDGLVLVASGMPHWRAYGSQGWQAHLLRTMVQAGSGILGYWPGWGFGGRQSAGVMRDWAHTSWTGEFPPALEVTGRLADITLPTLVLTVDGDTFTPPAVVEKLTSTLTSASIRREHLTTEAAGAPLDHLRWAKAAEPVTKIVLDWAATV
ncbi:alpha/beta hydrolase family protein [Nocardia stercoris]|uniref:alpha/beta hydrolase family protein n=1 Tax=Nocardia stercoris TaxID=2483361 RepID=UPI0018F6FA73|nr:alpha/beta fold hydrolase [Nocardia stercoris]